MKRVRKPLAQTPLRPVGDHEFLSEAVLEETTGLPSPESSVHRGENSLLSGMPSPESTGLGGTIAAEEDLCENGPRSAAPDFPVPDDPLSAPDSPRTRQDLSAIPQTEWRDFVSNAVISQDVIWDDRVPSGRRLNPAPIDLGAYRLRTESDSPTNGFVNPPRSSARMHEGYKGRGRRASGVDSPFVNIEPSEFILPEMSSVIVSEVAALYKEDDNAPVNNGDRTDPPEEFASTDVPTEANVMTTERVSLGPQPLLKAPGHASQWRLKGMIYGLASSSSARSSRSSKQNTVTRLASSPVSSGPRSIGSTACNQGPRVQVKLDGTPGIGSHWANGSVGLIEDALANPYIKALRSQREELEKSMDLFVPDSTAARLATQHDSLATLKVFEIEVPPRNPASDYFCLPEPCANERCRDVRCEDGLMGSDMNEELCELQQQGYPGLSDHGYLRDAGLHMSEEYPVYPESARSDCVIQSEGARGGPPYQSVGHGMTYT